MSTSGPKVYSQGCPGVAADALRAVCALLEEADVDVPDDGSAALLLAGGGGVWGTDPRSHAQEQHSTWAAELGLPPLPQANVVRAADPGRPWAALAEAVALAALGRALAVIGELPANAARSRFAQGAAAVLSTSVGAMTGKRKTERRRTTGTAKDSGRRPTCWPGNWRQTPAQHYLILGRGPRHAGRSARKAKVRRASARSVGSAPIRRIRPAFWDVASWPGADPCSSTHTR